MQLRQKSDDWYETLCSDPRVQARLNWFQLHSAAFIFAELRRVHNRPIGMGCIQLAEELTTSKITASKLIRRLIDFGYLKVVGKGVGARATTYELVLPGCARVNTHSKGLVERVLTPAQPPIGFELTSHSAFLRMAGSKTLSKSCAAVLVAVDVGCTTVREISVVAQLHPGTVRRNFKILESAGAIEVRHVDPNHRLTVTWHVEDVVTWLEKWSEWSGAVANAEILRWRHELQRDDYRSWRYRNKKVSKGGRKLIRSEVQRASRRRA